MIGSYYTHYPHLSSYHHSVISLRQINKQYPSYFLRKSITYFIFCDYRDYRNKMNRQVRFFTE